MISDTNFAGKKVKIAGLEMGKRLKSIGITGVADGPDEINSPLKVDRMQRDFA